MPAALGKTRREPPRNHLKKSYVEVRCSKSSRECHPVKCCCAQMPTDSNRISTAQIRVSLEQKPPKHKLNSDSETPKLPLFTPLITSHCSPLTKFCLQLMLRQYTVQSNSHLLDIVCSSSHHKSTISNAGSDHVLSNQMSVRTLPHTAPHHFTDGNLPLYTLDSKTRLLMSAKGKRSLLLE